MDGRRERVGAEGKTEGRTEAETTDGGREAYRGWEVHTEIVGRREGGFGMGAVRGSGQGGGTDNGR